MGLLKPLRNALFTPRPKNRFYIYYVRCKRCGEVLEGRVDLFNDLSQDYERDAPIYYCRKVLMGSGPCYQQVEASFQFDQARAMLERQVSGGEFVDGPGGSQ